MVTVRACPLASEGDLLPGDHDPAGVRGPPLHRDRLGRGPWPLSEWLRRCSFRPRRARAGSVGCGAARGCRGRRTSGCAASIRIPTRRPPRISAASTTRPPRRSVPPAETVRSTSTAVAGARSAAAAERAGARPRPGRPAWRGRPRSGASGRDLTRAPGDGQVDHVAVGPEPHHLPGPCRARARTAVRATHMFPTAGTTRSNSTGATGPRRPGRRHPCTGSRSRRLAVWSSGTRSRRRPCQRRRQPQLAAAAAAARGRGANRSAGTTGAARRAPGAAARRCIRRPTRRPRPAPPRRLERAAVVEQIPAQGPMEPLDLPVRGSATPAGSAGG